MLYVEQTNFVMTRTYACKGWLHIFYVIMNNIILLTLTSYLTEIAINTELQYFNTATINHDVHML